MASPMVWMVDGNRIVVTTVSGSRWASVGPGVDTEYRPIQWPGALESANACACKDSVAIRAAERGRGARIMLTMIGAAHAYGRKNGSFYKTGFTNTKEPPYAGGCRERSFGEQWMLNGSMTIEPGRAIRFGGS